MTNKGIYHNLVTGVVLDCELSVVNDNLYIYLKNQKSDLIIWSLKHFSDCRFDNSALEITYGNPVTQRLECSDAIAFDIYNRWSGNTIPEVKESFFKRNKTLLSIAAFCLALLYFSWFHVIPWVAEKSVALVPTDLEIEMGKNIGEAVRGQEKINDSATYFANKFIGQLDLDESYPIQATVVESEELNAFALPGGQIFIYTGILKQMNSYEELVALLGHEISHVNNRHSLKSIFRSAAAGFILSSVMGDASGMSSAVLSQINEFKQLNYSRELETEADNKGYEIMLENKTNPQGMVDLLKLLKKAGGEQPALMKYLSTHPDTDSRIKNVLDKGNVNNAFSVNKNMESTFNCLKNSLD